MIRENPYSWGPFKHTHCESCGTELRVPRSPLARFCSTKCCKRADYKKPATKARVSAAKKRTQHAVLGRACKWCPATDDQVHWSKNSSECGKCNRQRARDACGRCGGPRWRWGCPSCDGIHSSLLLRDHPSVTRFVDTPDGRVMEEFIPRGPGKPLGVVRIVLLGPNDEERTIYRSVDSDGTFNFDGKLLHISDYMDIDPIVISVGRDRFNRVANPRR